VIRILHVARYRDPAMHRKLELLARQPDLRLHQVHLRGPVEDARQTSWSRTAIDMWRPADPHRGLYRTVTFRAHAARPHIIHAEEEPDSLAALQIALARRWRAPGARLVLHTWQNLDRAMAWHVRRIQDVALRAADAVLCANQEGVERLARLGYRKPARVLPPIGVDTRVFAPADRPGEVAAFTVGYAGRLAGEKGIDRLIEAVARVRQAVPPLPVRLRILGSGPGRAALQASAAGLGRDVEFVGALPPAELAREMSRLHVLVLPSRTTAVWKEQFGRVLTEAMACKVPVVGSSSGAIPEVIGDAGLVFPEDDAAALTGCLLRLIQSPRLRADLAERGHARVMRLYTQERIAEQTADFYRWLIEQCPPPGWTSPSPSSPGTRPAFWPSAWPRSGSRPPGGTSRSSSSTTPRPTTASMWAGGSSPRPGSSAMPRTAGSHARAIRPSPRVEAAT
jgi:glycosyltransferase involved in cell wall biosynthesis